MKKEILWCLTQYASMVAETVQYTNWSDGFCRQETKRFTDLMLESLKKHIDWPNLTRNDVEELGFMLWCEDQPDLYLIPLYLLPILPKGTTVYSIFGDEIVYDGSNIDNDVRYGCLAYGIKLKY